MRDKGKSFDQSNLGNNTIQVRLHTIHICPPCTSDYQAALCLMVDLHLHTCHLHVDLYLDNCIRHRMQIKRLMQCGFLVRRDAQIVALCAHCTRTALKAPPLPRKLQLLHMVASCWRGQPQQNCSGGGTRNGAHGAHAARTSGLYQERTDSILRAYDGGPLGQVQNPAPCGRGALTTLKASC